MVLIFLAADKPDSRSLPKATAAADAAVDVVAVGTEGVVLVADFGVLGVKKDSIFFFFLPGSPPWLMGDNRLIMNDKRENSC